MNDQGPGIRRIDHVGVIVDDLDRVSRLLGEVLGMELSRTLEDHERGMRANFFRCGDVDIELIQLDDPEERERRLGRSSARMDHVAIEVSNLEQATAELAERGIRMNASQPTAGGVTLSHWSVPETTGGFVLQFLERLDRKAGGEHC